MNLKQKGRVMRTIKNPVVFFIAGVMLLFAVDAAAQTPKGNKNVNTVDYQTDPFDALEVGGAFKVFLTQSETPSLSVETDENLQSQVVVKVKGNTLSIDSKGISNPTKLNVYVKFTSLRSVEVSGAASVTSQGPIRTDKFFLEMSGASKANLELEANVVNTELTGVANATLSGSADVHNTEVSGVASLNALKFVTKNTIIELSGAAKARITATETISSDVSGTASLQYFDETGLKKVNQKGKTTLSLKGSLDLDSLKLIEVNENGDSTRVRIGNIEIEVVDGDNTSVTIGTKKIEIDDKGEVQIKKQKKPAFNGHWAGFHLGVGGFLTEDWKIDMPEEYRFLDLRYEKSSNVQFNFFEQDINLIGQKFGLVTGMGVEWYNFRFRKNNIKLDHATPILVGYEDESKDYTKSKLTVRYLNVPILFEYQTNPKSNLNSFHIAAGVVGGVRFGSHTKMVVDNSRRDVEKRYDDFHLSSLKADVMLRLGWGKLNLYSTYSLVPLFRKGKADPFHPFSVGLTLLSF